MIESYNYLPDQEVEEIEESIHEECIDDSQQPNETEESNEHDVNLYNEYNVMDK